MDILPKAASLREDAKQLFIMPYRFKNILKGQYYHLFNRGVNKQKIFFTEDNYTYCLRLIKKNSYKYQIKIIAYCLMPNHYHLLVRQDG